MFFETLPEVVGVGFGEFAFLAWGSGFDRGHLRASVWYLESGYSGSVFAGWRIRARSVVSRHGWRRKYSLLLSMIAPHNSCL